MILGVFLKALNCLYFKRHIDFFHEFMPQLLMLLLVFGYMDILIIIKWTTNYSGVEYTAPSIITSMINIPLNYAKIEGRYFYISDKAN